MKRRLHDLRRPSPAVLVASVLSLGGSLTLIVLSLLSDPMTASDTTRRAMLVAFAAAQTGLTLFAIKGFQRLYWRAGQLAQRRSR